MFFENLESRKHFTVTASVDAYGWLNVVGDNDANAILVERSPDGANLLVKEYAGLSLWYVTRHTIGAAGVIGVAIHGLGGPDTLEIGSNVTLPGGLYGGEGNDWLGGGAGMDAISGDGGNDSMWGNAGPDYLFGNAGNDLLDGGAGQDYMSGGNGTDTVSYEGRTDNLILRASGAWDSGGRSGWNSWESDCIHHDVENLTGGSGNDYLFANQLRGGEVRGGAGDDILYGSAWNDRLFGQAGADIIHGGNGYDFMVGGSGPDVFYARGDGVADTVIGGNEDYSGSDYDVAQVDRGPGVWDWLQDIHALLP